MIAEQLVSNLEVALRESPKEPRVTLLFGKREYTVTHSYLRFVDPDRLEVILQTLDHGKDKT